MKKIFTLLVLLMTTLCVSAQQYYKGKFHSKLNEFSDYETTVAVTQGEGGKYTLVFEKRNLRQRRLRKVYIRRNREL